MCDLSRSYSVSKPMRYENRIQGDRSRAGLSDECQFVPMKHEIGEPRYPRSVAPTRIAVANSRVVSNPSAPSTGEESLDGSPGPAACVAGYPT
jgi:hypothetical protein